MLTLTALLVSLSLSAAVDNDAVLLLSVTSSAGLPTDDEEVARRIAAELSTDRLRVSSAIAFRPGCENDKACVDEVLAGGRARIGIRCDVVRAGPIAQVSLQVFAHDEGVLIADERVVKLDELHHGAPILPTNVRDAIRAKVAITPETSVSESPSLPTPTTTTGSPSSDAMSPSPSAATTPANPSPAAPAESTTNASSSFPMLGAVGLGVATVGALLAVTGGGVLSMQLQVLADPTSLSPEKELATVVAWTSIVALAAAVVVAGTGTGLAIFGFMTHEDAEPAP